ncbi:hypothetical protein OAM49_00105 [bacterium]|jgi:hypothetical protein|nr:hypothetical protein [Pirellulales bacterium]MDC0373284.1 hypothetical protein [bacterium]
MKAADEIQLMASTNVANVYPAHLLAHKTSASPLQEKPLEDIADDTHRPSNTSPTYTTVAVNCS